MRESKFNIVKGEQMVLVSQMPLPGPTGKIKILNGYIKQSDLPVAGDLVNIPIYYELVEIDDRRDMRDTR